MVESTVFNLPFRERRPVRKDQVLKTEHQVLKTGGYANGSSLQFAPFFFPVLMFDLAQVKI